MDDGVGHGGKCQRFERDASFFHGQAGRFMQFAHEAGYPCHVGAGAQAQAGGSAFDNSTVVKPLSQLSSG
ncbi:hypothetical protein D9M68_938730 [compost metagenome]